MKVHNMNLKIFQSKRKVTHFFQKKTILFFFRVITHTTSVPDLQANDQIIPHSINEQQHMIELLRRPPLPTLTPSTEHF